MSRAREGFSGLCSLFYFLRPVYKPHSVRQPASDCLDDHLSRRAVTGPLVQPTRGSRETSSLPPACRLCPCLALLRMGVAWPRYYYRAGGLLPTFSPWHLSHLAPRGGLFLWPVRQISPPRGLPGILPYGVRTFLDPDKAGRDHPTSLRNSIIPLTIGRCQYFQLSAARSFQPGV